MRSMGRIIVYLDIFLELLRPPHCIAKLISLVRGINSTRVDYMLDGFAPAPLAKFRAAALGTSVRHKRVSSRTSAGEHGGGVGLSARGPW